MKFFVTVLMAVLCAGMLHAQAPENVQYFRYVLPGVPMISGMTTIKKNSVPKQAWFTEHDSAKVGTLIFTNKTISSDSVTEYRVAPVTPSQITYAEKAPAISDNAVKPLKKKSYTLPVWFIDNLGVLVGGPLSRDSVYALMPGTKKAPAGSLLSFPTTSGTIHGGYPAAIQWIAPSKSNPAPIWFTGFYIPQSGPPTIGLCSLEPRKTGTGPFEAQLTQYSITGMGNIGYGMHIENGLAWFIAVETQTGKAYLYAMPVSGREQGYRWFLSGGLASAPPNLITIQPLYSTSKLKLGVLPNQVWINLFQFPLIISLSAASTVDSICAPSPSGGLYYVGLFSDNASKTSPAKKMIGATLHMAENQISNIAFMVGQPLGTIQRESATFSIAQGLVHGQVRSAPANRKFVQRYNGATTSTALTSSCITQQWTAAMEGEFLNVGSMTMNNPVNICGMSDLKKFDLAFNQSGGPALNGAPFSTDGVIFHMYGTYAKPTSTMADKSEPDNSFAEESADETASEFALDDAYPNPFNPTTTIQFTLPAQSVVTLKVYNMLGQEVATLANAATLQAGTQQMEFDASNLPSGVYFYRIAAQTAERTYNQVRKIVLTK